MKKLITFGFVGLVTLVCILAILTQAREKMKVVCWGPHAYESDNSYWRNFRQIDSCFMNMLDVNTYTQVDFDSNQHYQFKLIEQLDWGSPIVVGQQSIYEADYYDKYGDSTGGYFWHSNVVGRQKYDPWPEALNDWAWYADPDSDNAGYIMRDLKVEYNNEQWSPNRCCSGPTTTFYADFRIKISNNSYQANPLLTLKAIRIWNSNTYVLDSLSIRPQDFANPNQYQTFSLTFTRVDTDQGYLDYTIWWDGSRAVWLDRVEIRDAYADSLFRGLYNQRIQTLKQQRGPYLSNWYLVDEPEPDQFATQAYLRAYLDSIQAPYAVQAVWSVEKMDEYLTVVNPKELWFDNYPLHYNQTDTATTGGNLQNWLSTLTDGLYQAKQKAIFHQKPLIYIAQAFQDTITGYWRYPTKFEQKVVAWLGLAYGANGIAYFTYATRDGIKGLVDRNPSTGYFEPHEPNWSAVRDVNAIIDSIGWLFADTTSWKGAGSGDTVNLIPGSFIHHLKSAEFESPWIEAGFFKDTVNTNYFMLVNRRCLSTEAQNVTVSIDSAGMGEHKKMWYVIDQYSQDTTFTGAINGTIPFTTHLDPGEGKLFKLVPFTGSAFHGTAHPLAWQGGIMIDGDVTVDSTKTLIIQPPAKVTFFANKDTLHTWDPDDCDFIINGGLRAIGTNTDSIVFTSTGNSPGDWEGIYVDTMANSGAKILSHCVVEYAYAGIRLLDRFHLNTDTISNSRFSHLTYGIHSENSYARIIHNSIFQDVTGDYSCGIYIKNINTGSTPSVTGNIIMNCKVGIYVGLSSTKVNGNAISTNWPLADGIRSSDCTNLAIDETSVYGDSIDCGFWINRCRAEILNSWVQGTSGHPVQNGVIFLDDSGSFMRASLIRNFAERGVWCYHTQQPDLGTEQSHGMNSIYSSIGSAKYVHVLSKKGDPGSVMAQYNWWGQHPPDSNRFLGPVVYIPALAYEPHTWDPPEQKVAVSGSISEKIQLLHNYPNPFNPETEIQFVVNSHQSPVHTTLKIYNILGQLIRTLVDEEKAEGSYSVYWDGRTDDGKPASSGIYFYKLQAGELTDVKKMVLLR